MHRWNPPGRLLQYLAKCAFCQEKGRSSMTSMLRIAGAVIALLAAATFVRASDPVVIGLEIPLSPPGDPTAGQLIRRGGELAIEYINGPMGGVLPDRKAALAVQDSQGRTESG